jgi:hypothetical protein
VRDHRLGDLPADGPYRVEGVHRALEDHGDIGPAVRRKPFSRPGIRSSPRIATRPLALADDGSSPMTLSAVVVLPGAGLADQPEPLPRLEGELDALDGVQLAAAGRGRTRRAGR